MGIQAAGLLIPFERRAAIGRSDGDCLRMFVRRGAASVEALQLSMDRAVLDIDGDPATTVEAAAVGLSLVRRPAGIYCGFTVPDGNEITTKQLANAVRHARGFDVELVAREIVNWNSAACVINEIGAISRITLCVSQPPQFAEGWIATAVDASGRARITSRVRDEHQACLVEMYPYCSTFGVELPEEWTILPPQTAKVEQALRAKDPDREAMLDANPHLR